MEDDEWLTAAETLGHVAAALVDRQEGKRSLLAELEAGRLSARSDDLSTGAQCPKPSQFVCQSFWRQVRGNPENASCEWVRGCFSYQVLRRFQGVIKPTATIYANGVSFRRQQVETLWLATSLTDAANFIPAEGRGNGSGRQAGGRPVVFDWLNAAQQDQESRLESLTVTELGRENGPSVGKAILEYGKKATPENSHYPSEKYLEKLGRQLLKQVRRTKLVRSG